MALTDYPTYPPVGDYPFKIQNSWCMGDSLNIINGDFSNLDSRLLALSAMLDSRINALSSSMSQYLNVPYIRAEVLTSNPGLTLGTPSFTTLLALNNILTNYGFSVSPTLNSGGLSLPSGTYSFKWTTSPFYGAEYANRHSGQWSVLNRSSGNAVLAQSPEIYFSAGTNYVLDQSAAITNFEGNFTSASSLIIDVQLYVSSYIASWNNLNGALSLVSRRTNSPVGVLEVWKLA